MKTVNRKRGVWVCLILMLIIMFPIMLGVSNMSIVSLTLGFVVGWMLRETLEPLRRELE
ncbi:MAG: hypothetical protein ACW99G_21715 [Candidatus Thorarchaeota archaeon]|jgi:hypothetical protein